MEDLVIDIPNSPKYLANFIGYFVLEGALSLSSLEDQLSPFVNSSTKALQAANILAEVFETIGDLSVRISPSLTTLPLFLYAFILIIFLSDSIAIIIYK